MDKLSLENVMRYITLLSYTKDNISLEMIGLVAEEVYDNLCEACCTTTFPQIAYRQIEKLIAYKVILNDIAMAELAGIKNLEAPLYTIKSTSIENTSVQMSDKSVQEKVWDNYKTNLNTLYNADYTNFVNRYRCLVW